MASDPALAAAVSKPRHSVAYRLLTLHAPLLELPAGFSVLDPSDVADLIDVAREVNEPQIGEFW
jgi:hypothetical protein